MWTLLLLLLISIGNDHFNLSLVSIRVLNKQLNPCFICRTLAFSSLLSPRFFEKSRTLHSWLIPSDSHLIVVSTLLCSLDSPPFGCIPSLMFNFVIIILDYYFYRYCKTRLVPRRGWNWYCFHWHSISSWESRKIWLWIWFLWFSRQDRSSDWQWHPSQITEDSVQS